MFFVISNNIIATTLAKVKKLYVLSRKMICEMAGGGIE